MVIGLTGGIASGKSLVAERLKALGATLIDADLISRNILEKDKVGYAKVLKMFGEEILDENREINRKNLGAIVFNNPKLLEQLNYITHPLILQESFEMIKQIKREGHSEIIVYDAALLIETGAYKMVDTVWLVICSIEKQIERILFRDRLSSEAAQKRIDSQMAVADKMKYADEIINNDYSIEETLHQVDVLWEKYLLKKLE